VYVPLSCPEHRAASTKTSSKPQFLFVIEINLLKKCFASQAKIGYFRTLKIVDSRAGCPVEGEANV
jgi:hypothetical protein